MIKETATVVAIDGDKVTVEAAIKSTCSACSAQEDCGTGVISRALAPKTQQLVLRTPMSVRLGQQVTVGIPEAGILSASAWLYMLPLVAFITFFFLTASILNNFGVSHELLNIMVSGVMTFFVYKLIAKKLQHLEKLKYQPVILEKLKG